SASGTNNTQNYTPGALTQTTWYRRTVTSGGCTSIATAIQITVNPAIANNTVAAAQTICSGSTPAALTGSLPTGGNGAYTYLWESSTTSAVAGFGSASGTNNTQNYTPGALTQTTWFRRTVTSGGCTPNTSTAIQITVNPAIANNTVAAAQTICSGSTPAALTGSLPTGGNGTYTYLWESSTTSAVAGFGSASGTNNTQNYTPGALTQTTWFRRTVSSSGCTANTSTAIQITVNPIPTISGNLNICASGSANNQTTLTGSPAGGTWSSGTATVATISSGGVVTGIGAGTTLITYSVGGCSNTATVTVNARQTLTRSSATVCVGLTTTLTGSATPAGTNPWVSSNTAIATVDNSGVVTGVSAGGPVTITYTNSNGCTRTASITVSNQNTAGTPSSNPTVCANTAIAPAITIATTGATGISNDGVSGANGLPAGV